MPKVHVRFTQIVTLDVPETKMKIGFCNKLKDELAEGLMTAYAGVFKPDMEAFPGIPVLSHLGDIEVSIDTP